MIDPITPSSISGLTVWLDSSIGVYSDAGTTLAVADGNVYQWSDQSGAGSNASQSTELNQPAYKTNILGGKPGILFSQTAYKFLTIPSASPLDVSTAISVVAVIIPLNSRLNAGVQGIVCKDYGALSNPPWGIETRGPSMYDFVYVNNSNSASDTKGGVVFPSKPQIVVTTINTATGIHTGYVNGLQIAQTTGLTGTIGVTSAVLSIGRQRSGSNTRGFDGYIFEVMVYKDISFTTGQRNGIESYLANKWGINTEHSRGKSYDRVSV